MKKGGTYMKKLTALTLTFCLLLALTGCQKNTDSSGSGAVADQKEMCIRDSCSCVYADKLIRVCVHFRPNLMLIKVICTW